MRFYNKKRYSTKEISDKLGIAQRTVRRWIGLYNAFKEDEYTVDGGYYIIGKAVNRVRKYTRMDWKIIQCDNIIQKERDYQKQYYQKRKLLNIKKNTDGRS